MVLAPFHFYLFLIFLFARLKYLHGTVTQNATFACVGESVTVSCVLTPPAGQMFTSTVPRFLVGDSAASLSASNINQNISHTGVDLTRFTAVAPAGTLTRVSGTVTLLSYQSSDEDLRMGCSAEYVDSGNSMTIAVTDSHRLNQSVIASSCDGNSTAATDTVNSISSYSLSDPVSDCLSYDNVSSMFTLNWGLSTESTPLLIQYSLRYNYTHTQGNVPMTSNNNPIVARDLSSTVRTLSQTIARHSFSGTAEVETNITVCLRITQQCGQAFSGREICCSTSLAYSTLISTTTAPISTINPSTSISSPSSSIFIPSPTTTDLPTFPASSSIGSSPLIIPIVIIALFFLIALSLNILFITIIIFMAIKNRKLKSVSTTTDTAPSHPYEYMHRLR